MKKIILIGVLGAILVGCGDRDENYFFENQEKAASHLKSCEEKLMSALENGDKNKFETLRNDAECKAADSALKKQRQLDYEKEIAEYELQRKQRQLDREKEEAERELQRKLAEEKRLQEIAAEKAKIIAANEGNTWDKEISEFLKQDCNPSGWGEPTVECTAWIEFYDEAKAKGKKALAQLDFVDLKAQSKEYCSLDQRRGSSCAIWQEALAEKGVEELKGADIDTIEARKDEFCADEIRNLAVCSTSWRQAWNDRNEALIKHFVDNDQEFVQTYNSCVDQLTAVEDKKLPYDQRYKEKSAITQTAPCQQAGNAYTKRGMGYSPFDAKIAQ